jgi:hypothetical protein
MQQRRSFDDMTVLAWQTHVQETSIADIRRMTKQAWMDRAVPLLISEEDQKQRKAEDVKAVCVKHELRSGLQHLQAWLHDWTDDSLPITVGVLVLGARPGVEKFGSGRLIAVYETAGQYLTGHVVHCDSGLPVVTIELGRLLNGGTVFPKAYVDAASALLQVTLKAMRRQRGRDGRQESWAVITSAPTVGDLRQTHPWVVQEYPSLCAYDRACNRHVLATQIRRGDLLKVLGLELVFATSVLLANYLLKKYSAMLSDTWEHDMSEIWVSVLMGFFVFLTVASVINASAIGLLSLLGRMLCLCRFHYADFLLEVDCELGPNRYDSLKKRRRRERREQRARLAKDKKTQ